MRCTKCGNKVSESEVFCSKCGEKLTKIRSCRKCGTKVEDGMKVCPQCGSRLNGKYKGSTRSKNRICIIVGAVMAVVMVIMCGMLNTDKSALKAYAKFQAKYYEKYGEYKDANDCCARIIMSPKGEKWLAILDATDMTEDSAAYRINLYRYSWGRVKKVTGVSNLHLDDYIGFSLIDGKLYMFVDDWDYTLGSNYDGKIEGVYYLNEKNKFVQEKVTKRVDKENNTNIDVTESGKTIDELLLMGNITSDSAFAINDLFSVLAEDFPLLIDELVKYEIKDQADLLIAYGKILKEIGTCDRMDEFLNSPLDTDYPVVGVVESEFGYYALRTSGNMGLIQVKNVNELDKALKEADGRKVSRIEKEALAECNIEEVTIPDNIDYIGVGAFRDCEKLQKVMISDGVTEIGEKAFSGCKNLMQIMIPDSVEMIGSAILDATSVPGTVIIAKKGTMAAQYAEVKGFDYQEKELDKTQLNERKTIAEAAAYYEEQLKNTEFYDGWDGETRVELIYLDDDKIPECVILGENFVEMSSNIYKIFSYSKGVEDEVYGQLRYNPDTREYMIEHWVNGYGYEYIVKSLEDVFNEKSVIRNFTAATPDEIEYTVDGQDLGSEEGVESYVSSLGFTKQIEYENTFSSVSEAYYYLKH